MFILWAQHQLPVPILNITLITLYQKNIADLEIEKKQAVIMAETFLDPEGGKSIIEKIAFSEIGIILNLEQLKAFPKLEGIILYTRRDDKLYFSGKLLDELKKYNKIFSLSKSTSSSIQFFKRIGLGSFTLLSRN
ncbi:hypothetical protein B1F79_00460 [Coxiella-like endosymbiont of Rhipicephalus sanguineus]|nr:hypothetical protein [Coxiella-like endosymbiont of Rhipicephalus sanguineus]